MMPRTKNVLFFAEAVTLAHVARCVSIANALHDTGLYQICLATDGRFDNVIGKIPYRRNLLHSISSEYFSNRLAKGLPIYDQHTLIGYVKEDIKIIESFRPDFIIGDFRLSLAISSRLTKIPYATIANAYWSPYANIAYPVPEIPLTKWVGIDIAQKLFDLTRPLVFWSHSLAFNQVCKKFGQSAVKSDLREVYTHADYTLYADIEAIMPMGQVPDNHIFIGPVLWSAQVNFPDWWSALPSGRPIVFVSLGSSGNAMLTPKIIEALAEMDMTIICATLGKTTLKFTKANVFICDFLPAQAAVKKSDLVICNGGSPMVYQALVEDKAVIGIPGNLDQYLMMSIVQNAGLGKLIRAGHVRPALIQDAVKNALFNKPKTSFRGAKLALDKITALIDAV